MNEQYQTINNQAWEYYENNDQEKAFELASTLVDKYPDKVGGYYLKGIIEHGKKNYPKSVDYFKNALNFDSESKAGGYIHYWLGKCYNEKSKSDFLEKFKENPVYNFDMAKFSFEKAFEYDDYPQTLIDELLSIYRKDNFRSANILKKATNKFPENIEFNIKYSRALFNINKGGDAFKFLESKAQILNSPSIYYELGILLFKKQDFTNAILNFEKAIQAIEKKDINSTAKIHYQIGEAYFKNGDFQNSCIQYEKSFDLITEYNNANPGFYNNYFFVSVFGFIASKAQLNNEKDIEQFISAIPLIKDSLEYIDFHEEFFLESYVDSYVIHDLHNRICFKTLNKIKKTIKNENTCYKINYLKVILYQEESKEESRLTILREILQQDTLHEDFFFEHLSESYYRCLHDRICEKKNYEDLLKYLGADLTKERSLRNNFNEYYLEKIIEWLFDDKNYKGIISLKKHFTSIQLDKANSWFEVAYSYNEIGDKNNAQKSYEHHLSLNKQSTAALNNLANIYHEKEQLDYVEKAIKLYEKAIKIDGEKELYVRNLKTTKATKESLLKEKSKKDILERTFKRAIDLLKQEDYFSLETLHNFLLNLKKDDEFENNEIAIQDDYFPSLMNTSLTKANKFKKIWLSKNYIFLTDEFDDYNIPIYKINPYIEDAINSQKKIISENDLPVKWLIGIEGINVSKLEEIEYFNCLEKIKKINKKYKPLIERDYNELVFNHIMGNIKSTIVLSGSFVELILTYYLEKQKVSSINYTNNGKKVTKDLYDCSLFDLISFIEDKGYFGKEFFHLTNLSRVYRNFIHPGLELKNTLNKGKSDICFISTMEIFKLI